MVRHVRFVLVLGGDGLVVLSALLSLLTYVSDEPSGLQYIFLIPAAALAAMAIIAGCAVALFSPRRLVSWANLALAVVALLVAAPWSGGRGRTLPLPYPRCTPRIVS